MKIHKNILSGVAKCAAADNSRYAMNSVYLIQNGAECKAVSTDSKVLIEATFTSDVNGLASGSLLTAGDAVKIAKQCPTKICNEVILTDATDHPEDAWKAQAEKFGETKLEGRKLEGRFPKYEDVFPAADRLESPISFGIDPLVELLQAMKEASGRPSVELRISKDRRCASLLKSTGEAETKGRRKVSMATGAIVNGVIMPLMTDRSQPGPAPRCKYADLATDSPDHAIRRTLVEDFPRLEVKWERYPTLGYYIGRIGEGTESAEVFRLEFNREAQSFIFRAELGSIGVSYFMVISLDDFKAKYPDNSDYDFTVIFPRLPHEVLNDLVLRIPFEGSRKV